MEASDTAKALLSTERIKVTKARSSGPVSADGVPPLESEGSGFPAFNRYIYFLVRPAFAWLSAAVSLMLYFAGEGFPRVVGGPDGPDRYACAARAAAALSLAENRGMVNFN